MKTSLKLQAILLFHLDIYTQQYIHSNEILWLQSAKLLFLKHWNVSIEFLRVLRQRLEV